MLCFAACLLLLSLNSRVVPTELSKTTGFSTTTGEEKETRLKVLHISLSLSILSGVNSLSVFQILNQD